MKLNNHGFSLKEMLLCMAVLLIALFMATFFSMQLMGEFGASFKETLTGKVTYATVERNVKNAATQYIETYYDKEIGRGTITVLASNLIENGLLKKKDMTTTEKDTCSGYALVRKNGDTLDVKPYITCKDYTTKDFQEWRMGEE